MTQHPELPPPPPPRQTQADFVGRLEALQRLWDLLIARVRLLVWGLAVASGVIVLVGFGMALHACSISGKVNDVAAQLTETANLLESLRAEQTKTSAKVDGVKEQVKEAQDSQPSVELRTVDAGTSSRTKAVIVVRPAKPKTPGHGAAPAIELPVQLPPGSRVEDAGAP